MTLSKRYVVDSSNPNRVRVFLPDNIADVFEGFLLSAQFMWNPYEREIAQKTMDALAMQFGIGISESNTRQLHIIENDGAEWCH